MTNGLRGLLACCAAVAGLLVPGANATATELGDFCWLMDNGKILRFSVTQTPTGHYTYTGAFDDGDGVAYSIVGEAEVVGSTVEGTFSGSLSTPALFKTGIWHVSLNPSTWAAAIQGIRQVYVQGTDPSAVSSAYRVHSAALTACP